jgi:hypothetical protein
MSMEIADSNKRYSIIIAGILVITIVAILVTFTLGVMIQKAISENGAQPMIGGVPYISSNNNSENKLIENRESDNLVSESEYGCDGEFVKQPTGPGAIEINVIQDDTVPLPLCITDDHIGLLDSILDIRAVVCGGYAPQSIDSVLEIWQCGSKRGEVQLSWRELGPYTPYACCCWVEWEADIVDVVGTICLPKSTELPNPIPSCMFIHDASGYPATCKGAEFRLDIYWEGCHFWTIPTSDFQFLGSLTPNEF